MIQIPQFSTINNKKITVAIPKRLRVFEFWEMNSVKKASKSTKNLVHKDYDIYQFRVLKKNSNYYVFQTTSNLLEHYPDQETHFIETLKSETVILIS